LYGQAQETRRRSMLLERLSESSIEVDGELAGNVESSVHWGSPLRALDNDRQPQQGSSSMRKENAAHNLASSAKIQENARDSSSGSSSSPPSPLASPSSHPNGQRKRKKVAKRQEDDSSSDDGDIDKLVAQYSVVCEPSFSPLPQALAALQGQQRPTSATFRYQQRHHNASPLGQMVGSKRPPKSDMILRQLMLTSRAVSMRGGQQQQQQQKAACSANVPMESLRRFSAINLYQRSDDVFVANSMKRKPTAEQQMQILSTLPVAALVSAAGPNLKCNNIVATESQARPSQRDTVDSELAHRSQHDQLRRQDSGQVGSMDPRLVSRKKLPILASGPSTGTPKSIITGTSGQQSQTAKQMTFKSLQNNDEVANGPETRGALWSKSYVENIDVEEQLSRLRKQERRSQSQSLPLSGNKMNRDFFGSSNRGADPTEQQGTSRNRLATKSDPVVRAEVAKQVEIPSSETIHSFKESFAGSKIQSSKSSATTTSLDGTTSTLNEYPIGLDIAVICTDKIDPGKEPPKSPFSGTQLDTIIEGQDLKISGHDQSIEKRRSSSPFERRASLSFSTASGSTVRAHDDGADSENWCICDLNSPHRKLSTTEIFTLRRESNTGSDKQEAKSGPREINKERGSRSEGRQMSMFGTALSLAKRTLGNLSSSINSRSFELALQRQQSSPSINIDQSSLSSPKDVSSKENQGPEVKAESTSTSRTGSPDVVNEEVDELEEEEHDEGNNESENDSSLMSLDDAEGYLSRNKENKAKPERVMKSSASSSSTDSRHSNNGADVDDGNATDYCEWNARDELVDHDEEPDEEEEESPKVCYKCNKRIKMEKLPFISEDELNSSQAHGLVSSGAIQPSGQADQTTQVQPGFRRMGARSTLVRGAGNFANLEHRESSSNTGGRTALAGVPTSHATNRGGILSSGGQQQQNRSLSNMHNKQRRSPTARRSASMNAGDDPPADGKQEQHQQSQPINRRKSKWCIQRNLAPKLKRQRSFSANYAPVSVLRHSFAPMSISLSFGHLPDGSWAQFAATSLYAANSCTNGRATLLGSGRFPDKVCCECNNIKDNFIITMPSALEPLWPGMKVVAAIR